MLPLREKRTFLSLSLLVISPVPLSLPLCSRDYFSSSYPNTIKFEENILRWRKSNSIFEPSASKLVAFPRLPLRSSQDSIESFKSTKRGALWVGNVSSGCLGALKLKSYRSLTFSISALFTARSDRQFE